MMKRAVIKGLLAAGVICVLLGCGKKEDDTQKQEEPKTEQSEGNGNRDGEGLQAKDGETEEENGDEKKDDTAGAEETALQAIGTESPDAYKVLLTNRTGDAITGFSVKASTEAEFPANMMEADMKVGNDETVCLYYAPPETEAEESSSGKMLRTTYEFSVTNENGREIRMPGLIFDDIEEAELCFEDEVGFIRYISVDSGEEITTKEMALLLQAQ